PAPDQFSRVYTGQRAPGTENPGTCPPAGTPVVPLDEVVTTTAAGKRFVQDTQGAYLTALYNAADVHNCNALRSEFSNPKDPTGKWLQPAYNEKEGDEAFYGVSVKWPT